MVNKVVVHYLDGTTKKGYTSDFQPHKDIFHLVYQGEEREKSMSVKLEDLKAVFFVKELKGKGKTLFQEKKTFEDEEFKDKNLIGKKVKVTFTDGEILYGLTLGYSKLRKGFFFTPIDTASNNERIFAVLHAVKEIEFHE